MKSTKTAAAVVLILLGLVPMATGQEAQAAEQRRRAQPRERAPRSEPAAAPAPERQPAPVRQADGGRARSRGTDDAGRVRVPRGRDSDGERDSGRRDRDRGVAAAEAPPAPRSAPPVTSSAEPEQQREQRRAVPRGSRPRGDNPAVGRAEPRDGRQYPRDGRIYSGGRGSRIYTPRGRVYNNYYYYPRRWYPYGYGAFGGLGYFYYDPYTWYSHDPYWSRPHHYDSYSQYRHYGNDYYYETGELRLQVHPRHAEVYVDGYFAGHVDDFDGVFQALRLEEGPYRLEIVAPGYETLEFEVRILPGRKTTYRGELRPRP
jgi:hypothetical protein